MYTEKGRMYTEKKVNLSVDLHLHTFKDDRSIQRHFRETQQTNNIR